MCRILILEALIKRINPYKIECFLHIKYSNIFVPSVYADRNFNIKCILCYKTIKISTLYEPFPVCITFTASFFLIGVVNIKKRE